MTCSWHVITMISMVSSDQVHQMNLNVGKWTCLELGWDDLNRVVLDEVPPASDGQQVPEEELVEGVAPVKALHLHDLLLDGDVVGKDPVEARAERLEDGAHLDFCSPQLEIKNSFWLFFELFLVSLLNEPGLVASVTTATTFESGIPPRTEPISVADFSLN